MRPPRCWWSRSKIVLFELAIKYLPGGIFHWCCCCCNHENMLCAFNKKRTKKNVPMKGDAPFDLLKLHRLQIVAMNYWKQIERVGSSLLEEPAFCCHSVQFWSRTTHPPAQQLTSDCTVRFIWNFNFLNQPIPKVKSHPRKRYHSCDIWEVHWEVGVRCSNIVNHPP